MAQWHHSEETRKKISEANIGRIHTTEHKRKIGASLKGHKVSDETKCKISKSKSGVKRPDFSEEWRNKISEAGRRRSPPSEETRQKLSLANKGRKRSKETCEKISAAKAGFSHAPHSEETKEKMREAAKLRHPFTEDQKIKISKTVKEIFKDKTKHPRWKGGVSYEPYCPKFNNEFKERVREFFGRDCVECGAPENGKKLCVHHVNFRKDACCTPEIQPLFVALCINCHVKTNGNRAFWENHFTELIMTKYNGQCYLPAEAV